MIGIVEEPSAITMTFVAGVRVCILVQKKRGYYYEQLLNSREVLTDSRVILRHSWSMKKYTPSSHIYGGVYSLNS